VIDLRTVLRDAGEAVRAALDQHGVSFEAELDAQPIWINGDSARLLQIHVNLLSNAVKYTPRGGHVHLQASREGKEAVIRVRDDGMGIAPNMLESAFDLFVQSRRTLDRAEGGLGVGLTLVRGLVAKHGGTVSARSDGEGKGSEFVVRLPLCEAPELPFLQPPRVSVLPAGSRIVVIEDNADSREVLCDLLVRAGFDCQSADNATSGIALIERFKPRGALIDIGLPGIDGLELARRLRSHARHKNLYLVALTGYGQRADRDMALQAGFDEHIVKPMGPDVLQRWLGRPIVQPEPSGSSRGSRDAQITPK
jgi:two-component system CheB/CheR fusion protein